MHAATRFRSVMRFPYSNLKWEAKILSQIVKTLIVNELTSWRLYECYENLNSTHSFRSLVLSRDNLNHLQSLPCFMYEACSQLLVHADKIEIGITSVSCSVCTVVSEGDICRLSKTTCVVRMDRMNVSMARRDLD